jgi:hypothetical protein
MLILDPVILNLAVALGIGQLIGGERERRKGEGPSRSPAGILLKTDTVAIGGSLPKPSLPAHSSSKFAVSVVPSYDRPVMEWPVIYWRRFRIRRVRPKTWKNP